MTEHDAGSRLFPKMTIRTRMSLWFTLVLALICALLLVVAAAAFGAYGKQVARAKLVEAVQSEASTIEASRGYADKLAAGKIDETEFVEDDVQLMVYGEGGEHFGGLFLYGGLDGVAFSSSDVPQVVELDGSDYYYYDKRIRIKHGDDYWVRGIVRAETSIGDMLARSSFLLVLIPLLILVAFFGGRLMAGRFLQPVREIDQTARAIRENGDLTRRIPVSDAGDELSALASDMNEMLDTLERNFQAERTFASSASHELRTPIAVVLAECEYALEDAASEGELREALVSVRKQGEKMSDIVEALLMLTRMEQGTDRYALETLDLGALAGRVLDDFERMHPKAHIKRDLPAGVSVRANRGLLQLALDNTLRNAVRYGGEDVSISVVLSVSDGVARLSVADDGPGVAREELERIWELFYRADASRSTEGLGLGLPLVRKVAEYHGGSASAESALGEGSTFAIKLPVEGSAPSCESAVSNDSFA